MREAAEIFNDILKRMPSHRHKPGKLMDAMVYLHAHRSSQFLENPEVVPRGLDPEEGCHDFSSDLMPRDWYDIQQPAALARLKLLDDGSLVATAKFAGSRVVGADQTGAFAIPAPP